MPQKKVKTTKKTNNPHQPQKLSKVGQWMKSNEPPLWDLSDLTPKEYKAFMRQVMK